MSTTGRYRSYGWAIVVKGIFSQLKIVSRQGVAPTTNTVAATAL